MHTIVASAGWLVGVGGDTPVSAPRKWGSSGQKRGRKKKGRKREGRSVPPSLSSLPSSTSRWLLSPLSLLGAVEKIRTTLDDFYRRRPPAHLRPGLVHTPVSHARAPLSAPCTPPGACGSIFVCAPLWQSWLPLLNPLGRGRPSRLSAWSQVNSPRHRHRPHAAMCTTSRNPPGPARNFALGSLVIPIHPPAHPHEACVPTLDIAPYPPPPTHPPAPPPGATADNPLPQPPPPPPPTFWQPPRP